MSELQNDGIPAGYRLVGVRRPKLGELWLNRDGDIRTVDTKYMTGEVVPVVEDIPPIPSNKITVVLNKYLVGYLKDTADLQILVCTQEHIDAHYVNYRFIEHVETLEMEVAV